MADYQQKVSASFQERRRLNRLRKKKEALQFWEEFKLVPGWLKGLMAFLYLAALAIAIPKHRASCDQATHDPTDRADYRREDILREGIRWRRYRHQRNDLQTSVTNS
jgi:hypothetical protein